MVATRMVATRRFRALHFVPVEMLVDRIEGIDRLGVKADRQGIRDTESTPTDFADVFARGLGDLAIEFCWGHGLAPGYMGKRPPQPRWGTSKSAYTTAPRAIMSLGRGICAGICTSMPHRACERSACYFLSVRARWQEQGDKKEPPGDHTLASLRPSQDVASPIDQQGVQQPLDLAQLGGDVLP